MPPASTTAAPPSPDAADADAATAASAPPAWTATVSVRSLCEFTAKRGDLDRRFAPSATAVEGLLGQAAVVARRRPGYETEVALETVVGTLRVRGRADGVDPALARVEEVKTIRGHPDHLPDNRRALHWAQLETYGALLCRRRGYAQLTLALVYVDAETQAETVVEQHPSAAELDAALEDRCARYAGWALQESAHRAARDAALAELAFPPRSFRPGQRELAEAVYRSAAAGRCLLAQAPTGIGKTLGTLYPLLRAVPGQKIDKIGYLTCKGTGRATALDALAALRDASAGRALRVLALVAKEQACVHPGSACHGDACALARGFYDRLPQARAEAVTTGFLDPDVQRRIALSNGVCPYYLGQELLRWADVVVADVHHAFDPHGQLFALAQALDWRIALLVDEAHNLVDRARQMYGASLSLTRLRAAGAVAPTALRPAFRRLLRAATTVAAAQEADHAVHDAIPSALADALQALVAALGDHLQREPAATGPLLEFHFDALRLQRGFERHGTHTLFEVERRASIAPAACGLTPEVGGTVDATLSLRNIVPGSFLRPRWAACRSAVLFSATLVHERYQRDLLGLPDDTRWVDVPPAFDPAHLQVRVARRLSTRYPHRRASLDAVAALMARQFERHPGNYLAFFSSFEYLEQAADRLAQLHPLLPQWRQSRAMDDASRRAFLQRFVADGRGIAYAVLGGAFAEGVDLPGTRLIGAFVATLGLPPVSKLQEQVRSRLDTLFGSGHGYADLVPGLQKVVQAAGRVLRTPDDRGWLWLMDDRYRRPEVLALLPASWRIDGAGDDASGDAA